MDTANSIVKAMRLIPRVAILVCVVAIGVFTWLLVPFLRTEVDGPDSRSVVHYEVPPRVELEDASFAMIRHPATTAPLQDMGPLARRFRLAGTFFAYSGEASVPAENDRRAILDDLVANRQHLVREGQRIGEVDVVQIQREQVTLRDQTGEERLYLSFAGESDRAARPDVAPDASEAARVPLRFEDMPTLETTRFGRRIGDERWIMRRDALLAYAAEVQGEPERLTALLMAMQPDFGAGDDIQGFVLNMLGENDLYEAAGFQNGDIVRMVNSMPMTSPARAEYFLREFFQGNISALVFDIERDGEDHKLIHLVR